MGDEVDPTAAPRDPTVPPSSIEAEDPFLGRTVNGRVKIVRAIARGGMGKVYYGEQLALSRPCAVKVLEKRLAGGDAGEFNKRFLLEASTSAKLTHPNVVKIFDYGETEDGVVWLAMEYLDGKTLSQELEGGRLEPGRAINIAMQVARALREAHALGVVHRDMKPGNVFLLTRDDEGDLVTALDFGLVKVAASVEGDDGANLTQIGQIMGSPKYMAPEQSQGHAVDARADIYSLGATLFAMICGRAPFERPNAMATMMAHLSEPVPHLADAAPGVAVPPGLDEILQRCMAKDREQRYASMDELLQALRSYRGPGVAMISGSGPTASGPQQVSSGPSASISSAHMPAVVLPPESARRLPFFVLALTVAIGGVGVLVIDKVLRPEKPETQFESVLTPGAAPRAAPSAPPSASAAPVAIAVLEIVTEPPGARVKEDGLELCASTPCRVTFRGEAADAKLEHLLEVLKPDYRLEKKLVRTGAGSVTIKLSKAK